MLAAPTKGRHAGMERGILCFLYWRGWVNTRPSQAPTDDRAPPPSLGRSKTEVEAAGFERGSNATMCHIESGRILSSCWLSRLPSGRETTDSENTCTNLYQAPHGPQYKD